MKVCPRCSEEKPLAAFSSRRVEDKIKYHSYCRDCMNEYRREWARANPSAIREEKRRYRATHREEIRQYKRRNREEKGERIRERERLWRKLHPEEVAAHNARYAMQRRGADLLRKHGLTLAAFAELWEAQDGKCAICRRELPTLGEVRNGGSQCHVDHDHNTSEVRGLLCGPCNQGLGLFRDNPGFLRSAAMYLETAPERRIPRLPAPGPSKPWDYTDERIVRPQPPLRPNHGKTHCPAGHPYEGDNLYVDPRGYRKCRTCIRRHQRERALRKRDS